MRVANQDSTIGDGGGGIDRSVKDYCTKAVVSLKAGRFKEAYLFANEALELHERDPKAAALYRYALYTLQPKKRPVDKAKALHEEAERCINEWERDEAIQRGQEECDCLTKEIFNKAYELLTEAKKWHCTPGILFARSNANWMRKRVDLAYSDVTEALAMYKVKEPSVVSRQVICLRYFGYKVLPAIESEQQRLNKKMPAHYQFSSWPKGLQIHELNVDLPGGHAEAITNDRATLKPRIPLDQLALFLNDHVRGAMGRLGFDGAQGNEAMLRRLESVVPRVLDEVTVPGRLHTEALVFTDLFHLPWASIERILDGRTLRANTLHFIRLRLPGGVNADRFLELPTIRGGNMVILQPYSERTRPPSSREPLFSNAAVMEWAKCRDGRTLFLPSHYLASGLIDFLNDQIEDFCKAAQAHSYHVNIYCPGINVIAALGLGDKRQELHFNRLGEMMRICVGEDPAATVMMGHRFETVALLRSLPQTGERCAR